MLVKIEEIQEPGLSLKEDIKPEVLTEALTDSADFKLVKSGPLEVQFRKIDGQVHVKGGFAVSLTAPCKRCATDVPVNENVKFNLRMIVEVPTAVVEDDAPKGKKGRKEEPRYDHEAETASFELDEIDAEPFDGKKIDMNPIVREQVLLALPVSVLCKDSCKGLCLICGGDLNVEDCGHGAQKEVDARLAKLRDIKLKPN